LIFLTFEQNRLQSQQTRLARDEYAQKCDGHNKVVDEIGARFMRYCSLSTLAVADYVMPIISDLRTAAKAPECAADETDSARRHEILLRCLVLLQQAGR